MRAAIQKFYRTYLGCLRLMWESPIGRYMPLGGLAILMVKVTPIIATWFGAQVLNELQESIKVHAFTTRLELFAGSALRTEAAGYANTSENYETRLNRDANQLQSLINGKTT